MSEPTMGEPAVPSAGRRVRGRRSRLYAARTFALTIPDHRDAQTVIGYGMTLPDGSAVVVSADSGQHMVGRYTDARTAARLYAADLIWTNQPAEPRSR